MRTKQEIDLKLEEIRSLIHVKESHLDAIYDTDFSPEKITKEQTLESDIEILNGKIEYLESTLDYLNETNPDEKQYKQKIEGTKAYSRERQSAILLIINKRIEDDSKEYKTVQNSILEDSSYEEDRNEYFILKGSYDILLWLSSNPVKV